MPAADQAVTRRSSAKRAAILDAAESLFTSNGYERTSVDAIAGRAGVSKRTIYDHFGDKEAVFGAALERAGAALGSTLRAAIDEELRDGRDLRDGLLAFSRRVTTDAFQSSAYVRFRRLADSARALAARSLRGHQDPEELFEGRISELASEGLLDAANPARAAQHFIALTLWITREAVENGFPDDAAVDAALVDGVDAFLRAYAPAR